jgi:hypothetical protein
MAVSARGLTNTNAGCQTCNIVLTHTLKFPDLINKPFSAYILPRDFIHQAFPVVYYEDSDVQSDVVNISFILCIIYAVPKEIISL